MKQKILYIIALLVLLLSQSCVKQIEYVDSSLGEGEGWLYVNFGPQELIQVQTKATQNYNSENSISNLYIFLFDSGGNKLYGKWLTSSSLLSSESNVMSSTDDCWYVANSSTAGTPTKGCFKIKASAGSDFKLYVITNLDSDMSRISSDLLSHSVATEADLLKFKLVLNQESVNRNINFPMLGSMTKVSITANQTNKLNSSTSPLKLDRIDSKVRFVFKTGKRADAKGQKIKSFEARQWKVVNVPISSFLVPQATDAAVVPADAKIDQYESYAPYFFETDWRNFEDYTTETQEFSFYMLENRQAPKNDKFDSYQKRSLQKKTASGLNQTVNVNYTSLHGEDVSRSLRVFQNANDFSTYVLVTGRVEMKLENDAAGQTLGADVQYLIHLGNWSSTISGSGWAADTYTNVADYNTQRNYSYTYTVTVNSVDNIRVEVETGAKENQPGASGEVIIAKEEIALCDAHYVSKTMTFHAKNFVTVGSDGTVTSTADRLTWKVKTPFGEGAPKKINGIDIADDLDYKWVHFRLNKQSENKSYYANKRRKYTQRVFESKAIPQSNLEDDGSEGLYGYHNDGCMDIIQLVQYIKDQVGLYADYRNEVNSVLNNGGVVTDVENHSDFDTGLLEDGSSDPDGPKICVTAFVDEYYYDEHPITKRKSPTLWKYFVNQDDRTMHILCDSNSSTDLESTSTGSVITIQQQSIKSIFNTDPTYDALQTAWGLESIDEFSDKVKVYNVGGESSDSGKNLDKYNGRANSVFEWGLAPSGTTFENITDLAPNVSWSTYINYEVPNDTPLMQDSYKSLRYFCMARNRDNNGNGKIERDEVRWYLASIQQLVGLFVGNGVVQQSARLYYRTPAQKASNEKNDWYQFVISSTHHSKGPTVIWGQEGLSTSSLYDSQDWEKGVTAYGIRCVRNLGIDSNAPIKEAPADFLTKTENADGSVTFEATHLNAAALRDYTSTDLPYADEWSSANRLYKRFEVAPDYTDFSSPIGFAKFQADIDARGSYLSGYCPEGYRIPNQMELAMMNYYMGLEHNLYSRTYWSFGPYSGNYGPTGKRNKANDIGFLRLSGSGNLTVDASNTTQYARCVKDIRMN
ncbi:MAG: fimbrial protein [Candidatus Cryptobacteroides sp.]|nr:fimbrial protein [Bacteroidales bacterium]MDY6159113.1 fimbrial protein [Candidatus Cryptobacteroides sp.]